MDISPVNIFINTENSHNGEFVVSNIGLNTKNTKWFKRFYNVGDEFFNGGRE